MKKELFSYKLEQMQEDDRRLLLSASLVFLAFSLFVAHLLTKNMLWQFLGSESVVEVKTQMERQKTYEVLLEQEFVDQRIKDEIKALSDKESAGSGGLTQKQGFHTFSTFREFIFGGAPTSIPQPTKKESAKDPKEDEVYEVGIYHYDPMQTVAASASVQPANPGQETRIPMNYRFEQDFRFMWDGSKGVTVPTKKLPGYHYFKNMLHQIEDAFAAPGGGNIAFRDMAGTVIRAGINPGETKVLFMMNPSGQVIDTRLVSSQGQAIVDKACIEALKGQNFGAVPKEVLESTPSLIFGINFIFPEYR